MSIECCLSVSFPLRGKREERVKKRLTSEACQWSSHPERHSFPSLHLLFTQVKIQRRKLSLLCLWMTVELSRMHFLSFSPLLEIFVRKSVNGNRVTDDTKWRRERSIERVHLYPKRESQSQGWVGGRGSWGKETRKTAVRLWLTVRLRVKLLKCLLFLVFSWWKIIGRWVFYYFLFLFLSHFVLETFAVVCGIGFSCLVSSLQCVVSWVSSKQHIQGYLRENMCLTCHVISRDSIRDPGAEKREAVGEEKGEVLLP